MDRCCYYTHFNDSNFKNNDNNNNYDDNSLIMIIFWLKHGDSTVRLARGRMNRINGRAMTSFPHTQKRKEYKEKKQKSQRL